MIRFSEVINSSLEWAATVTFRPFNPKKWLILGFVSFMAGYMASGCNLNLPKEKYQQTNKKAEAAEVSGLTFSNSTASQIKEQSPTAFEKRLKNFFRQTAPSVIIAIIITSGIIILAILILMMWLSSRFSFIFLENVVKNDASIRIPFRTHKEIGNSLFLFSLVLALIFIVLLGIIIFMLFFALIKMGVFGKTPTMGFLKIFLTCLPFGILLFLIIFIAAIIGLITQDFVLVAMFKDRLKIRQAWKRVLDIIRENKVETTIYLLLKVGLNICMSFLSGILALGVFCGLLLPLGIIALLFYFLYLIMPAAGHFFYFIILFIIAAPLIIFLWYCLICLYVPFAVFRRTLSLKFIARLSPHYNLFRINPDYKEVVL